MAWFEWFSGSYMHEIEIIPVGWGSFIIHIDRVVVPWLGIVTDGGCVSSCYRSAWGEIAKWITNKYNFRRVPWLWIISHIDYDHLSIVSRLIKEGMWSPPSAILLPGSYAYAECRETLIRFYSMLEVAARMLEISPPRYSDILDLVNNLKVRKYGVSSGTVLKVHGLEYRFIWPDPVYSVSRCIELGKALERKIEYICRRWSREGEAYRECREKYEEILQRLRGSIKPIGENIVEKRVIDVEELIESSRGGEPLESLYDIYTAGDGGELSELTLYQIIARGLGDMELLFIGREIINSLSLAYAVSPTAPNTLNTHAKLYMINSKSRAYPTVFMVVKNATPNDCLLLYLADLDSAELDYSLSKLTTPQIFALIAPHHGNACHTQGLSRLRFDVVYISRCNHHTPRTWRGCHYYHNLHCYRQQSYLVLVSGHTKSLTIHLH